jgi:hypothetical protein
MIVRSMTEAITKPMQAAMSTASQNGSSGP